MPRSRPRFPLNPLAFLPLAIIILLIALLLYVYQRRRNERMAALTRGLLERQAEDDDPLGLMNEHRARGEAELRRRVVADEDAGDGEEEGDSSEEGPVRLKKIGKRKAEKLRRKEERRQYNEWIDAQREQRRLQDELLEDEFRRRKIEEEEIRVKERLEQEKRQQKIAAEQEAESMRQAQAAAAEERRKDELVKKIGPRMVDFIKAEKMTSISTLSSTFKISREDVMLLLSHHTRTALDLTGVFDEPRDRYVYIDRGEFEKLAAFVHERGRVRVTDIAEWIKIIMSAGSPPE